MLDPIARLSLALAAALALALAFAPGAAAEPTCVAPQDGVFACVEVFGGPEAGGAGVAVTNSAGVHTCVAYTVPCPGNEEG